MIDGVCPNYKRTPNSVQKVSHCIYKKTRNDLETHMCCGLGRCNFVRPTSRKSHLSKYYCRAKFVLGTKLNPI